MYIYIYIYIYAVRCGLIAVSLEWKECHWKMSLWHCEKSALQNFQVCLLSLSHLSVWPTVFAAYRFHTMPQNCRKCHAICVPQNVWQNLACFASLLKCSKSTSAIVCAVLSNVPFLRLITHRLLTRKLAIANRSHASCAQICRQHLGL